MVMLSINLKPLNLSAAVNKVKPLNLGDAVNKLKPLNFGDAVMVKILVNMIMISCDTSPVRCGAVLCGEEEREGGEGGYNSPCSPFTRNLKIQPPSR